VFTEKIIGLNDQLTTILISPPKHLLKPDLVQHEREDREHGVDCSVADHQKTLKEKRQNIQLLGLKYRTVMKI
jgi:hypothetical protein